MFNIFSNKRRSTNFYFERVFGLILYLFLSLEGFMCVMINLQITFTHILIFNCQCDSRILFEKARSKKINFMMATISFTDFNNVIKP